jgi:hypothetical protein
MGGNRINENLCIVKWKYFSSVTLLSCCIGSEPGGTSKNIFEVRK